MHRRIDLPCHSGINNRIEGGERVAQKRRHSRTRTATRRSHFKLKRVTLVTCPQCKSRIVSHRVCPTCGFYAGQEVIAVEAAKPRKKQDR